ncbi:MAG: Ig-like domain-containing protein [Planctomycetes bacterium]|nr:Ig-like domain-containing protein [Planctomycetota bacterium]MBI3833395.1 Ig-like domain-containing protein [Planctomycetota bacterium]
MTRQRLIWLTTASLALVIGARHSATVWAQRPPNTSETRLTVANKTQRNADITPPRIISITPSPANWVVDNIGVREIRVGFSETVIIPPVGAVLSWTLWHGGVTVYGTSYDSATNTLIITPATPVRDDRLTLIVTDAITDAAGNPLDGEIDDPANPTLPSGNGSPGGRAVFRINILQGDVNRDGVVNDADGTVLLNSLGKCTGMPGFNVNADLNIDGCVNALDVAIYKLAKGRSLPPTDLISREVSVFNRTFENAITDTVAREISVFNSAFDNEISDSISREVSVENQTP